ncbi:MAG: sensor domain CHASE-containing protein/two-component sensor histidine kinase [Acidimicrobiales bacterium]|jgi:sensor domain CHASE-containing protein/two-component sensor histidine kinase
MTRFLRKLSHITFYVIIVAVVMGTVFSIVKVERELFVSQERRDVEQKIITLRAQMEQSLNQRLFLVTTLKAHVIAHNGELDGQTFNILAAALLDGSDGIRSIQLAPNAVVTQVQPLEGNEAAVGHDLLNDDKRRDAVERGIQSGTYVVAGPLELRQGGTAIIARQPIYLPEASSTTLPAYADTKFGAFWGFATVLIDFDVLISASNLDKFEGITISMRGKDGLGDQGSIFYGDIETFESDPVLQSVTLPEGSWQIAAIPVEGWSTSAPIEKTLWIFGFVISGVIIILSLFLLAVPARLRRQVAEKTKEVSDLAKFPSENPNPIMRISGDYVLLYANNSSAYILKDWKISQGQKLPSSISESIDKLLSRKKTGLIEFSVNHKCYACIFYCPENNEYINLYFRDITNEKAVDRAKTEFVSLASHQLRTPLSVINWHSEMLADKKVGKLNEKQKEYVHEIREGSLRMTALVGALLNATRLDLGTFKIEPQSVDVKTLLEKIEKQYSSQIVTKSLVFKSKIDTSIKTIIADTTGLNLILDNLISNAVKYSREGGVVQVTLSDVSKYNIQIEVADQGYGIPADQHGNIFTKMFRADNVITLDTVGTGLGLYMVESVVRSLGGTITFTSKLNEGTSFIVTLPKTMKPKKGSSKLT